MPNRPRPHRDRTKPIPRLRSTALLAVLLGLFALRAADAQIPRPFLHAVQPPSIRAGETVDVTIDGANLEGADGLWFENPGLSGFLRHGKTFTVTAAPDLAPGHYDVRVVSPLGVSNPRTIVVGRLPQAVEQEPNNTPPQANPLAMASVVCGSLTAADVDSFRFDGKKGQRVLLDLEAWRLDSKLDATIRLIRLDGTFVSENRDTHGADPFLDVILPDDGTYVIVVHDVVFGGSPGHFYRLTLHEGPHVDSVIPVSVEKAGVAELSLVGRNLGGTTLADQSIEGRPVESRRVSVQLGAAALNAPLPSPSRMFAPPAAAGRVGFEFPWGVDPAGRVQTQFVALAEHPVIVEQEPNSGGDSAQAITLPCEVSGAFGLPGDVDVYRFPATKGQTWIFEVEAERLGSSADPTLVIQKVEKVGPAKDLATADDVDGLHTVARFNLSSVDATLRWQVPEDATYQVRLNDLYLSQRGDPRLFYRLKIRPERPDFRLFVVPESATQPETPTLRAGGRCLARILAWRVDGFAGPIRIEAEGLPPGVRCEPVVIGPGQNETPIVLEADTSVEAAEATIRFVGRSRWLDRKDSLGYQSGDTALGLDRTQYAIPGGITWPPTGAPADGGGAPARVSQAFVLAVLPDPAPLALTASSGTQQVAQGGVLRVQLGATRRAGLDADVAITLGDPPPNVALDPLTIAKDKSEGRAILAIPNQLPPGPYTLVFNAAAPYPFSPDVNAKTKPNVTLAEPSNPIVISVRPAPVTLTTAPATGTVPRSGNLELTVTIARQNGFTGPVRFSLEDANALGLVAESVSIDASQTTAKLAVRASNGSPEATGKVGIRAVAEVKGEPVEVENLITLTVPK